MLLLVAIFIALLLMTMTTYEHMTNKDVMSALKKYGTEEKPSKSKEKSPPEAPIYGPKAEPPAEEPSPTGPSSKSKSDTGVYPEIYGPDVVAAPGEKIKNAKHESDRVDDETYDYNPDLQNAFPTSGPPQPFLTDFSRFQK